MKIVDEYIKEIPKNQMIQPQQKQNKRQQNHVHFLRNVFYIAVVICEIYITDDP